MRNHVLGKDSNRLVDAVLSVVFLTILLLSTAEAQSFDSREVRQLPAGTIIRFLIDFKLSEGKSSVWLNGNFCRVIAHEAAANREIKRGTEFFVDNSRNRSKDARGNQVIRIMRNSFLKYIVCVENSTIQLLIRSLRGVATVTPALVQSMGSKNKSVADRGIDEIEVGTSIELVGMDLRLRPNRSFTLLEPGGAFRRPNTDCFFTHDMSPEERTVSEGRRLTIVNVKKEVIFEPTRFYENGVSRIQMQLSGAEGIDSLVCVEVHALFTNTETRTRLHYLEGLLNYNGAELNYPESAN